MNQQEKTAISQVSTPESDEDTHGPNFAFVSSSLCCPPPATSCSNAFQPKENLHTTLSSSDPIA